MEKSSSHNPPSPEITPKKDPVTLDKPESPNLFLPADQVEFTFEEISLITNNEVVLLYPSHPNSEYFKVVSNFISKCCLNEAFTRGLTQYKEYLCEFWYTTKTLDDFKIWVSTPTGGIRGDIGITTFRNALRAHYLPHSSMYVPSPSITVVRPWFVTIGYSGEIGAKGTLKKSFLPPRWRLLMAQIILCLGGKTGGHDQISNKDAIILYCLANRVKTEASKSKTGQSDKETQSISTKDKSPSHPSPSTPVVGEMHKEAQQAAGGPTSLGATSKEGAHPHLSSDMSTFTFIKPVYSTSFIFTLSLHQEGMDEGTQNYSLDHKLAGTNPSVLIDKTKSAEDGLRTAHTDLGTNEESRADEISKKIKLEDLLDLMKDTRSALFTPNSPQDEPIIF
ncbi:hypothetical protein Tco_0189993 [Tanacetum coccineum]